MSQDNSYKVSSDAQKLEVIDNIMERKVGFGTYQKKALAFLCLIDFNDGLELIMMSLTLPIIRNELNKEYKSQNPTSEEDYITGQMFKWLGSIFFIGNLFGAILTGPLSDKFGRRSVVLFNSLAYGLIAFSFLFVQNLLHLFVLRLLYGFVYGITLPISTTYYTEIVPTKMRGKGVVTINASIAIGMLVGVIAASIILTDTTSGNWRALISLSCIPALILFYGTYNHLLESPRFLIVSQRIPEAAEVLNQMITINLGDGGEVITQDEMESLEIWRAKKYDSLIFEQTLGNIISRIGLLFQKKYLMISISLCVQWFGIHLMSIGQLFVLPLIQQSGKKSFADIFITLFGEVPGFIFTYFIIDRQILGRKNSLQIFFLITVLLNILAFTQNMFSIVLAMSRFCYRQIHAVLYVYTNEIYETPLRSTGMGFTSALARFSTVIMPFILMPLFEFNSYSPFLFSAIISAICAAMVFKLPFDTMNMKLDHVDEELQERNQNSVGNPDTIQNPNIAGDIPLLNLSSANKKL